VNGIRRSPAETIAGWPTTDHDVTISPPVKCFPLDHTHIKSVNPCSSSALASLIEVDLAGNCSIIARNLTGIVTRPVFDRADLA
jgi:hypothetical protein